MDKKTFVFIIILTFIISVFVGINVYLIFNKKEQKVAKVNEAYEDNTTIAIKDSVENEEDSITINSSDKKITPHTMLTLRKYYEKCGHSINEYVEMPAELINLTEEELKEQYKDWNVYVFSESEVILIKNIDDFCNEHYKLKELDGYIAIYKVDRSGKEQFQEKTGISTRYLTETDLSHLKNEINIFGTENLNKYIEDFE